jgi:hypothetical protein
MSTVIRTSQLCALMAALLFPLNAAEFADAKLKRKADFWTFKKADRPAVPTNSVANPIDAFIQERLQRENLHSSPPADRRTLARRIYFDLTGLPPAPEELQTFLNDKSPNAYKVLVDRLLNSKRYGERWARYWLDIVHFGESHGYDKDKPRPNAWPYRDYVIQAANNDIAYSRFVQEQLAGDVLFPDDPQATIATGFIAAGPWDFVGHVELPETKTDGLIARYNDRDDMVMTTMSTFQSLTVHCARCHDHKFDPITQEDYYRLQAVFAGVDRADRLLEPDSKTAHKRQELKDDKQAFEKTLADLDRARDDLRKNLIAGALGTNFVVTDGQRLSTLGYHSNIEKSQDFTKWVQLDFAESFPIDAVALVPAFEKYGSHQGPAFGFPPRFKIEMSDDPEFKTSKMIRDETAADYPSPGDTVVMADAAGARAKHIRITATKLWKRTDDWIFALGEAWVISEGKNIASTATVRALDSIEAPPSWAKTNLIDGIGVQTNVTQWADWKRREKVLADVGRQVNEMQSPEQQMNRELAVHRIAEIAADLKRLPPERLAYVGTPQFTASGSFKPAGKPRPISLLKRGDVKQPVREVQPGAVGCLPGLDPNLQIDETEGSRRAALAKWLTQKDNFLLRRSIVNRVWQFHFGKGLVDSPNDFGHMGSAPSHPELLDWLAYWFMDNGESLKALHKLIVTSAAYQQSSADNPDLAKIDSDNRFLWRMNRARLDAEEVRDTMLYVSGQLDERMGGPSDQQFYFKDDHSPIYDYTRFDVDSPNARRRSIYRFIVRSVPDPLMDTLDCPDASLLTGKRTVTVTALQALATLNNPFVLKQCERLAESLEHDRPNLEAQITRAFELALSRPPTKSEQSRFVDYASTHGLPNACRVIFNTSEFLFVD